VPATWADLEAAAPELARLGRERLEAARVALLGTLDPAGAPRINPVEPCFGAGRLLLGLMAWSLKARDLLRDPRCVLHSAVTDPDAAEGELKLYGSAELVADAAIRESCPAAWWLERPPGDARVFALGIERAAFVGWDLERSEMTVWSWTLERGARRRSRPYP
jgi:Pyridoxamine 5'-phosphate oxidase